MSVGELVKEERLYLRLSASQKKLLADAAALSHTSLSEFALVTSLIEAEQRLLDQRVFVLGNEAFDELEKLLSKGPNNSQAAQKTMSQIPPWEK